MTEKENFTQIGDHRDIPMSLGLIVMAWNACELNLRHLLRELGAKGAFEHGSLVEILISEMGSVSIAQALNCFANEFPEEEVELSAAISHTAAVLEAARPYRNYYIHNISGVTRYGLDFGYEIIENETPMHEAMMMGPFAKVYSKTAKRQRKFFMDFITDDVLASFNNYLAEYYDYIHNVTTAVIHYMRQIPKEERALPPPPLRVLDALKKPAFDHPKLKQPPALAFHAVAVPGQDDK